jgi:putative membrane-bound dehydrogenase-like protein
VNILPSISFCRLICVALPWFAWLPAGQAARFTGEGEIHARPLPPDEALKHFRLEAGLRIELVAAEPLTADPVEITFDERGRMFVVENSGYNRGANVKPRSRIRALEDRDGDGRMDHGWTVADDLDYAQGILALKGGLLVTTNSEIIFLRGLEEGKPATKEVLFTCTKSTFVDHQMGSPRRGIDNWVYINNGLGGKEIVPVAMPGPKLNLGALNLRYNPSTGDFGPASGRGQFGNTFDDWGHEFVSVNRNPGVLTVMPYNYVVRNPQAFLTEGDEDVLPSAGDSRVYPLKTFRTTSSAHAGTFTAACGISAYRGDRLGEAYVGNLFVCEPTGELVSRWILKPKGASFTGQRPEAGREFLASDDEWFRPVNTCTGPDGALYIVDMYRRFIDGTRFFPDDYVATNDMGAGSDRGRIYRVVPAGEPAPRPPAFPTAAKDQVALLAHRNGWQRDTAQRLLVEAGDPNVIPAVEDILFKSGEARGRVHALWTIDGLGQLGPQHVRAALGDAEPGVVENALWLAGRFVARDEATRRRVFELCSSPHSRVRFAALLVVGDMNGAETVKALVAAGLSDASNNWTRAALLSSAASQQADLLVTLLQAEKFRSEGTRGQIELVNRLALILAARGDAVELRPVFALLADERLASGWWPMAALSGFAEGLRRQRGDTLPATLGKLIEQPPAALAASLEGVRRVLASSARVVGDAARPVSERLAAISLLTNSPKEETARLLSPLLDRREPVEIQNAALEAVLRLDRRTASALLYGRLAEMGGAARAGAIQYLQRSGPEFLQKIKSGVVNPALVDASGRWLMLNSSAANVRAMAQEVFGKAEGDRKGLVKKYAATVPSLSGSAAEGKRIFTQTCAVCHIFRGFGADVGPDISDVRIKSAEMLLSDILDPNGTVEPRWESYSLTTKSGGAFVGVVASESNEAIVLKGISGKETVLRKEVAAFEPMGRSLMPEGFESTLTEKSMADLLAYLRSSPDAN